MLATNNLKIERTNFENCGIHLKPLNFRNYSLNLSKNKNFRKLKTLLESEENFQQIGVFRIFKSKKNSCVL